MSLIINWTLRYVLTVTTVVAPPGMNEIAFIANSKLMAGLLFGTLNFLIYYTVCEKLFNRKTVENGLLEQKLSGKTAMN